MDLLARFWGRIATGAAVIVMLSGCVAGPDTHGRVSHGSALPVALGNPSIGVSRNSYQPDFSRSLPGMTSSSHPPHGRRKGRRGGGEAGVERAKPEGASSFVGELALVGPAVMPYIISDRVFEVRTDEVVAIGMAPASRDKAKKKGFQFLRTLELDAVGFSVDILRPPEGMSLKRAIKKLKKVDPQGDYEPNAIFNGMGAVGALPENLPARLGKLRVGIVDTGFDETHSAFSLTKVIQRNFGRATTITERDHGALVAALAVQSGAGELFVADAFSGQGEYADAESLARALNWLADEKIPVINMSIAGPPSILLERTIGKLAERGHVIVAAVGNDGPETPPQYPAAYPSVVGVTAVDRSMHIYDRANRGPGVDISSVGVNISVDGPEETEVSGTSFASPAVAAFLASYISSLTSTGVGFSEVLLESHAIDLGEPGKDPVYGAGYLSPE